MITTSSAAQPLVPILVSKRPIEEVAVNELVEGTLCICAPPRTRMPYLKKRRLNGTGEFLACANWERGGYQGCGYQRIDSLSASVKAHQKRVDENLLLARRYLPLSILINESAIFPAINHNSLDPLGFNSLLTTGQDDEVVAADGASSSCVASDATVKPQPVQGDESQRPNPLRLLDEQFSCWSESLLRTERAMFEVSGNRKPANLLPSVFEYPTSNTERAGVAWLCRRLVSNGFQVPKQVWKMRTMETPKPVSAPKNETASESASNDASMAGNIDASPSSPSTGASKPVYHSMPKSENEVAVEWCDSLTRRTMGCDMRILIHGKWQHVKIIDLDFAKTNPCVALQLQDAAPGTYGWLFGQADWWLIPKQTNTCLERVGEWFIVDATRFRSLVNASLNHIASLQRHLFSVELVPFNPSDYLSSTSVNVFQHPDASAPCPALSKTMASQCGTCGGLASAGLHEGVSVDQSSIDWEHLETGAHAASSWQSTFLKASLTGGHYQDEYLVSPVHKLFHWCETTPGLLIDPAQIRPVM